MTASQIWLMWAPASDNPMMQPSLCTSIVMPASSLLAKVTSKRAIKLSSSATSARASNGVQPRSRAIDASERPSSSGCACESVTVNVSQPGLIHLLLSNSS